MLLGEVMDLEDYFACHDFVWCFCVFETISYTFAISKKKKKSFSRWLTPLALFGFI